MTISRILHRSELLVTYIAPVAIAVAIIVVMNTTNPLTVGPGGILAMLSLLYVGAVLMLHALATAALSVAGKFYDIPAALAKKLRYITTILGFGPVLLLALNSIGHIGVIDIILVAVFTFLGCFYVARRVDSQLKVSK